MILVDLRKVPVNLRGTHPRRTILHIQQGFRRFALGRSDSEGTECVFGTDS